MTIRNGIRKGVLLMLHLCYKVIISIMRRILLILNDSLTFLTVKQKQKNLLLIKEEFSWAFGFLWKEKAVTRPRKVLRLTNLTPCLVLFLFFLLVSFSVRRHGLSSLRMDFKMLCKQQLFPRGASCNYRCLVIYP